jgi:uncharacterized membrane protein YhdT
MRALFHKLQIKRDFYAGGLMILLGIGTVVQAQSYKMGALTHMGPGFFPTMLGVALILVGILIAGSAAASSAEDEAPLVRKPEWFAWLCIIAGPILFIGLGHYAGLAPAIFGCVFVSALGDRTATYRDSFFLATGITIFGVALFSYVLKVPFPVFRWVLS